MANNQYIRKTIQERIESKISMEPTTGCWLWTGSLNPQGYGRINIGGRNKNVHHISWELYMGPVPEGFEVCHHCDTPSCASPFHLFVATHSDNMYDCKIKGRRKNKLCGITNPKTKLTEEQVLAIRNDSRKNRAIGKDYGVDRRTVGRIKNTINWKHLP